MKHFLNRRGPMLANGTSHLVPVQHAAEVEAASHADDEAAATEHVDAQAPSHAEPVRPVTPLRAVPVVPNQGAGRALQMANASEVQWLSEQGALATFRSFSSFDYSVKLLFHANVVVYYIALYQQDALWRVLKAIDLDAAQAAFHHFEDRATRLADGETRRAQLEAQNEQLARLIEESEAYAERLRNDLQRSAVQEQAVTSRQHQVRKDVAQLEALRTAAQAQLNKTHRQVHQLRLTNNEGLPRSPR